MDTIDEQFDDFKPAEPQYVNDAIKNILGKEQSELDKFKDNLDEQLSLSEHAKDTLTEMVVGYIQAAGDVNAVTPCTYRAKNGVGIDAWGYYSDDDTTVIDLFLSIYQDQYKPRRISGSELDRHFNWLLRFYEQSQSGSIFSKIEGDADSEEARDKRSDLNQIAQLINTSKVVDRIRLFILTNAIAPGDFDKPTVELDNGASCEFYVWDAKRIMQQDYILSGRIKVAVDFERDYNSTLPFIKMPDVSDNVTCYLTIISGKILAQIYNKYHQQLLEHNVRTFLQFKGASNKGIRDTLIGHKATARELAKGVTDAEPEPDMFFAYNNGISTTAEEVQLNDEGNAITKIKSWQIVNGGQTTAAISAVMKMKDVDLEALSKVYVQMKISVVKRDEDFTSIVSKISKYANTQSVVKKSDLDVNSQFLIDIEQLSREEWVMNANNHPVSKWFFERTRGQYLDKAKRSPSQTVENEFYAEYPKEQMFDKGFLAKVYMAWEQNPAVVCHGGEPAYSLLHPKMVKNKIRFDRTKYHRVISMAILFKALDAYFGKDGVDLPGYKSHMVAYTLSFLSFQSNKSLDLDSIWKEQCVLPTALYKDLSNGIYNIYAKIATGTEYITYKVRETYIDEAGKKRNKIIPHTIPDEEIAKLKETTLYKILQYVKNVSSFIYNHLINVSEGENVHSKLRSSACWETLKAKTHQLGSKAEIPSELLSSYGNTEEELTEGQIKALSSAAEVTSDTWDSICTWSKKNPNKLTPREYVFISHVAYMTKRSKPLSYKQSRWALDIKEKVEGMGWSFD